MYSLNHNWRKPTIDGSLWYIKVLPYCRHIVCWDIQIRILSITFMQLFCNYLFLKNKMSCYYYRLLQLFFSANALLSQIRVCHIHLTYVLISFLGFQRIKINQQMLSEHNSRIWLLSKHVWLTTLIREISTHGNSLEKLCHKMIYACLVTNDILKYSVHLVNLQCSV